VLNLAKTVARAVEGPERDVPLLVTSAIARYDHVREPLAKPQEVILRDPQQSLKFIREAVPSFVRCYRLVYVLPHERSAG
jgi:hypothetical protein